MKRTGGYFAAGMMALILVLFLSSCTAQIQQGTPQAMQGFLETRIIGQRSLMEGAPASLRIVVYDARGFAPVRGADITGTLVKQGNQKHLPLFSAKTDELGTSSISYMVPEGTRGSGTIEVEVKAGNGARKDEIQVNVADKAPKVSLSTDKPLYQPGQTIHIKALALQVPTLVPLAKSTAAFEITDPKGNRVLKSEGETSRYGIVSLDFQLASEVNMGEYTITATGAWGSAAKKVIVKKYVLPKFKTTLETAKKYYSPGETVEGNVSARYFFGKPVTGAEVVVSVITGADRMERGGTLNGTTDKDGFYKFTWKVPATFSGKTFEENKAFVQFEANVIDTAKHKEMVMHRYTVAKYPISIQAVPESGKLAPRLENTVYLLTSYPDGSPAECTLDVALPDGSRQKIASDSSGYCVLPCTPKTAEKMGLAIEARDKQGNCTSRTIALETSDKEESILVRPDRTLYLAGDTFKARVQATRKEGTAYLDFLRDGTTIFTQAMKLSDGRGSTEFKVPDNVTGTITINGYYLSPYTGVVQNSRTVYFAPQELKVAVSLDKESYRPGEEAKFEFKVTDKKGNPAPSAVGVDIVDESVFGLFERRPGLEAIHFLVPPQLLQAPYQLQGSGLADFLQKPRDDKSDIFSRVALAAGGGGPQAAAYTVNVDSYAAREQKILADLEKIKNASMTYRGQKGSLPSHGRDLVMANILSEADLLDPWGRAYIIKSAGGPTIQKNASYAPPQPEISRAMPVRRFDREIDSISVDRFQPRYGYSAPVVVWDGSWPDVLCLGADGREGTPDDYDLKECLVARGPQVQQVAYQHRARVEEDARINRISPEASDMAASMKAQGAPSMARAYKDKEAGESLPVGAPVSLAAPQEPVRVRDYFPETLLSKPEIITDDSGRALLTVPLADSITTWRLSALANSAKGELGSTMSGVKVFQDFFIDLDLPVALTQGDEVAVPVAIYNYLPERQDIELTLDRAPWFELMEGSTIQKKSVEKEEVSVAHFRIKAKEAGMHKLTVTARGKSLSDAISRDVEVSPDGKKYVVYKGDFVGSQGVTSTVDIPREAVPGASALSVTVYPRPMAQVIEGMDRFLAMPTGCFEQTSSTLYPDIVVLDYLRKTKQASPELEKKAQYYINQGCQRLMTFESRGGGFSYYGGGAPSMVLSAYGLMIFSDASKVAQVDQAVIDRTKRALLSRKKGDGSWTAEGQFGRGGPVGGTAYIAWAMSEAGARGEIADTINLLKGAAPQVTDPYTLALMANAMLNVNPGDTDAVRILEKLRGMAREQKDTASWQGTSLYGYGAPAAVETTALVSCAMLKAHMNSPVVGKALKFIVSSKHAGGLWQSTQATALAMRALSLAQAGAGGDAEGTVTITVNGTKADSFTIRESNRDLFQQFDLKKYVKEGANTIRLSLDGKGSCAYQVTGTYYLPWERVERAGKKDLAIEVAYDRREVKTAENINCRVNVKNMKPQAATQVMVVVGTPPGFDVVAGDLDTMVKAKAIQKYETYKGKLVFYLNGIGGSKSFNAGYRLVAKYPIKAKTPVHMTYLYYEPEVNAQCVPVTLNVL
jgi:hypothetical protein